MGQSIRKRAYWKTEQLEMSEHTAVFLRILNPQHQKYEMISSCQPETSCVFVLEVDVGVGAVASGIFVVATPYNAINTKLPGLMTI
jgi:hypothetical protein